MALEAGHVAPAPHRDLPAGPWRSRLKMAARSHFIRQLTSELAQRLSMAALYDNSLRPQLKITRPFSHCSAIYPHEVNARIEVTSCQNNSLQKCEALCST